MTIPFLVYWTFPQLTYVFPTYIPNLAKSWFASWYLCDMFNNALEGIQPTFKHVPPRLPLFYIQTVFKPNWPALIAATYPWFINIYTSGSTSNDCQIVGFSSKSINKIISEHWLL